MSAIQAGRPAAPPRFAERAGRRSVAARVGRVRPIALVALAVAAAALTVVPVAARAEGGERWRFAPAAPPPQPEGSAPAPFPLPLGTVGQISFWAPNRGLLITGGPEGNGGTVPAGLYAYNGVEWHQLSTVCGGGQGRIAWAGPDDFWTISDQRAGQEVGVNGPGLQALSLCHFLDGQVVASYAMPVGQRDSYLRMDAAACLAPDDCWFAGDVGTPPNGGSFHLHWDGHEVQEVYDSASDHIVSGMASFNGRIYEGLGIGPKDGYQPAEDKLHPPVLRTIAAAGQTPVCEGESSVFCNVFTFSTSTLQELPVYPRGVSPDELSGFGVVSDGSPLGERATQLWAGANPEGSQAMVTILHKTGGSWSQVVPNPNNPQSTPLPEGMRLSGSADANSSTEAPEVDGAIAPEPGTGNAWVSLNKEGCCGQGAMVILLEASGKLLETQELPGPEDHVGDRGEAGPITCVAPHDCWMATRYKGWLFHLGSQHERDTDPNFAGVITYRPPDASLPTIYPDLPPEDDSLANQQPPPAPTGPPQQAPPPPVGTKKGKALVTHVRSSFLHHRVLVVSFTLSARAHVQLVGRRRRAVVASTHKESLRPGHHVLSLTLDPAHWPTKLQFNATPIKPPAKVGSEAAGTSETITT